MLEEFGKREEDGEGDWERRAEEGVSSESIHCSSSAR